MSTENLWGSLTDLHPVRTPTVILREQANLLGQLTDHVLRGAVDQEESYGQFRSSLFVIAPSVNNYRREIIAIQYFVDSVYPVEIIDKIHDDIEFSCENEPDFISEISKILQSFEMKNIILILVSESTLAR